jgi:Mg-chelatase subunit ChlD
MNHNVLFNRATIKGWELRQGVEAFTHHACAALDLAAVTLEWQRGIRTAAISARGEIYLSNVNDDATITRATLVRYCGFVVHELLHRKYTNFDPKYDKVPYLAALHNAVEDAWIEHSAIDAGLLGNIAGLLGGLVDQMVTEAKAEVSDWSDPCQYPFLLAIYLRRHAANKIPLPAGLSPIFDAAAARVLTCTSTDETFKLAAWIYAQLQALPQRPEQQDQPDQGQPDQGQPGQDQGQDQGQPGQGDQEGPQDASEPAQSADQGQGEGAADQENGSATAPGQDCDPVEVEPSVKAPEGAASSGTWSTGADLAKDRYHINNYDRLQCRVTVPAKLRYEVRRLFEDSATTMLSPNRKSGAINPRALHKFGQSDALFQLRRDIDGIDSAVVIVVDVSSSMFDHISVITAAVNAAAALVETLEAAGVKSAIVTFGSMVSLAAGFDTRAKAKIKTLERIGDGGSTNDYAAIRYAHDLLRGRPEARKVCFVLTDGDGNRQAARQQAQAGEALGITTIGVGIKHNVSGVYTQAVQVNDMADLGRVALGQIKLAA